MTPEQRLITKIVLCLLLAVSVFFAGFGVRSYMATAEKTRSELALTQNFAKQLGEHSKRLETASNRNLQLQAQLNELDQERTKALNEQLDDNARLRTDLAVAQRMRLQGTTCTGPSAGKDNPGAGGVGDGTPVELSEETRLLVWDLREDLIRDYAKLEYMQAWAKQVIATNPDVPPLP